MKWLLVAVVEVAAVLAEEFAVVRHVDDNGIALIDRRA